MPCDLVPRDKVDLPLGNESDRLQMGDGKGGRLFEVGCLLTSPT